METTTWGGSFGSTEAFCSFTIIIGCNLPYGGLNFKINVCRAMKRELQHFKLFAQTGVSDL